MAKTVNLSTNTKEIATQLKALTLNDCIVPEFFATDNVNVIELSEWLKEIHLVDEKERFLLETLQAGALKDLRNALINKEDDAVKDAASWVSKLKFILLLIAGTIFFGCEGFDGITAILSVFPLSPLMMVLIGFLFSGISIFVFYGFDLFELAQNLGIELKSTPKIIDCYLQQIAEMNAICECIEDYYAWRDNDELKIYLTVLVNLQQKVNELHETRKKIKHTLDRPLLITARYIATFITGLIFFSNGFLAGQTVALYLAALLTASATPVLWPVILASTFVAICALIIYWYIVHPEIENLIGRWMGLDKEKLDQLCDMEEAIKQERKFSRLLEKVEAQSELLNHTQLLTEQVSNAQQRLSQVIKIDSVKRGDGDEQHKEQKTDVPFINKAYFDQKPLIKKAHSIDSFLMREEPTTVEEQVLSQRV